MLIMATKYLAGAVLGGFWGPQKPSLSQIFLLIVHKTFLNQWMVKTYCVNTRIGLLVT